MQIKTITTAAGTNEIDFGNNDPQSTAHFYWFKNLGDSTLYVSANPNPVAGEDNVAELPAKGAASVETDEGKVYVLGAGKVEIHRTNSKFCPFELPSTGSDIGGIEEEISELKQDLTDFSEGGKEVSGESAYTFENAVEYPVMGLNLYGKSTQDGTPTPENPVEIVSVGDNGALAVRSCGKNFYEGSQDWSGTWVYGDIYETADETYHGLSVKKKTAPWAGISKYIYVQKGQTVTFSCYAKSDVDVSAQMFITSSNDPQATALPKNANKIVNVSTKWARYEMSYTCIQSGFIRPRIEKSEYIDGAFYVCGFQIEIGGTATDYEPYHGATANITSALPLCGIPVSESGNYTDSNGQQWVCDELIYNADGSGKIIKNLRKVTFNGSEDWVVGGTSSGTESRFHHKPSDENAVKGVLIPTELGCIISDHYQTISAADTYIKKDGVSLNQNGIFVYEAAKANMSLNDWKNSLAENPFTVEYQLAEPQEIPLTAAEMSALRTLQTFNGITNISNDSGAEMTVGYCTNKMLSEYVVPITTALQKQIDELKSAVLSLGGNV